MPFELTIAEGKGRGQRFSLDAVDVTIGRGADNDIVLNDAGVSRNHARIRKEGPGWMLSDNGSSNGTDLNGAPIDGPTQLRSGDRIGVGPILFRFETRAPDRAPPMASQLEPGREPGGGPGEPIQPPDEATRITTMPQGAPGPGRPVSRSSAPTPGGDETRIGALPVQGPGREARMQAGQTLQSASLGEQFARLPPAVRAGALGALLLVAGLGFWAFARSQKPHGIQCPDVVALDDEVAGLSFGRGVVDVDCGGKAAFGFNVPPKTKVLFHYLATRISAASELELKLNGHHLGWAPVAAARGEEQVLSLPVEQLQEGGNRVSFLQSKRSNEWSVTKVRVELLAIAPGDLRAAQGAYELGRRKLVERRIAPRNLYDAWKYFVAARRSMEELSPRPPLYDEVAQLIKDAERDMEKDCQRMLFSASRSDHYGQQGRAQQIYREVLLHFPGEEPSGCRKKAQESIVSTPLGGAE